MESLAKLNNELVQMFPPGIKIILSQWPLSDYSLLISFGSSIIGIILLILVIRWDPPRYIPAGLRLKTN